MKRLWPEDAARTFLATAAHERAHGPGLSDATLDRLAALQDPDAAASKAAFVRALTRAGWRPRRITKAVAVVQGQARAESSTASRWSALRGALRQRIPASIDWAVATVVLLLLASLGVLVTLLVKYPGLFLTVCASLWLWEHIRRRRAGRSPARWRVRTGKRIADERTPSRSQVEADVVEEPESGPRARRRSR